MSVAHVARQKGRPRRVASCLRAERPIKCARLALYKHKRVEDAGVMARKGMVPWLRLCLKSFESKKGHEAGASENGHTPLAAHCKHRRTFSSSFFFVSFGVIASLLGSQS